MVVNSRLFLLLAATVPIGLVLGFTLPAQPKILGVLNDLAHAPVFGLFALIVLRLLHLRRQPNAARLSDYGIALLIATGVGGLIELIQSVMERDAELEDLLADTLGAGCALGMMLALNRRTRPARIKSAGRIAAATLGLLCGLWALLPLGQAAIAYFDRAAEFPVVARFSSPRDLYFISSPTARLSLRPLPEHWARPDNALSLRIDYSAGAAWPGASHDEPEPDWRGFSALALDLTNPAKAPLHLAVRVHDAAHDQRYEDRFNRAFEVMPLSRTVLRIPLRDIAAGPVGRSLDLAQIAGIVVFEDSESAPADGFFYLNKLWLE